MGLSGHGGRFLARHVGERGLDLLLKARRADGEGASIEKLWGDGVADNSVVCPSPAARRHRDQGGTQARGLQVNGRPGYAVDLIAPLAGDGAHTPANMQWRTIQEAKEKDRRGLVE